MPVIYPGVSSGSVRHNMEKHDAFFIVLYGSFFAVIVTFIISFDGSNGFGGTNKITTIITAGQNSQPLTGPGEDNDNKPKRKELTLTKWDDGKGDQQHPKAI